MKFEQLEFPIVLTATTQDEIGKARDHYELTSDEVTQAAMVALSLLVPVWRQRAQDYSEHLCARILLDVSKGFREGGGAEKEAWETCLAIWGSLGPVGEVG